MGRTGLQVCSVSAAFLMNSKFLKFSREVPQKDVKSTANGENYQNLSEANRKGPG